MEQNIGSSQL